MSGETPENINNIYFLSFIYLKI